MYYDFMDEPLRNAVSLQIIAIHVCLLPTYENLTVSTQNILKMYRDTSIMLWNGQSFTGVEKVCRSYYSIASKGPHTLDS